MEDMKTCEWVYTIIVLVVAITSGYHQKNEWLAGRTNEPWKNWGISVLVICFFLAMFNMFYDC